MFYAKRAGGGRTVPVLVTADGEVLPESSAILRWADNHLEPEDRLYPPGELGSEAARIERWLDAGLGPDSRLWMYQSTLPVIDEMSTWVLAGTPKWEQRILRTSSRAIDLFIRRYLGINPHAATMALSRVEVVFDDVARLLADGRPYLAGDRFTAADVAFAALSAAVLVPEAYGSPLPLLEALPAAMVAEVERMRATDAGRFASRMYAEHRHAPVTATA